MESIQVNGQRIWGPPSDWSGPLPPHGTEVYVKNVPEDIMEADLYRVFASAGEIYEVRVPVHWNGLNRGYAFVRYTKTQYANRAIRQLNKLEIRVGWQIRVERSIDNNRLFLSAVPNHKTSQQIFNDLKTVVENVKKVYVYTSLEDPTLFRGYAFVEFICHRDAAIAKRILTPDLCFNLFEKKCIAAWANPLPFLHDSILKTINVLFMRNIPNDVKTMMIKKMVEMLVGGNSIERIKRLNDIAFITFKTHELAKKALDIIKGRPFLGPNEIEIEWAVPRQLASMKISPQNSASETKTPSEDKDNMDHVKQIVEMTWSNRLKKMKCFNNILMRDSNLTDRQKHYFDASGSVERNHTILQLAEELRSRNLSPKDFINNNIVSFKNQPEDFVIDDFRRDQDSANFCRLVHLQYWFEKLMNSMDDSESPPEGWKEEKAFRNDFDSP